MAVIYRWCHRYLDLFFRNNVNKRFFTLCLNVFTLFDSLILSDNTFQISGP